VNQNTFLQPRLVPPSSSVYK